MLIGQKSMKASNEITESLHWKLKGIFKALLFFCYSELGGIASFSDYSQSLLTNHGAEFGNQELQVEGTKRRYLRKEICSTCWK